MTTVATDGRSMAADSYSTINGVIVSTSVSKIQRLPDGSLYGASGDSSQGEVLFQWLSADPKDRGEFPAIKEVQALVLRPDGVVEAWDELSAGHACRVEAPAATGSGERFAIGAMDAGVGPAQAVKIAAKRDPYTGGDITAASIDELQP